MRIPVVAYNQLWCGCTAPRERPADVAGRTFTTWWTRAPGFDPSPQMYNYASGTQPLQCQVLSDNDADP